MHTRSPSSTRSIPASHSGMTILRNSPCTSEIPREHSIKASPPAESGIIKTNSPLTFKTGPSNDITSSMTWDLLYLFLQNCWTGTSGQGTLGALSIEQLGPHRHVGIEPTTSRSSGETFWIAQDALA